MSRGRELPTHCTYFSCSTNCTGNRRPCYGCRRRHVDDRNESYLSSECCSKNHVCCTCVSYYLEMRSYGRVSETPFETSTVKWIETSLHPASRSKELTINQMCPVKYLPQEMILLLMEYLKYEDQVVFISCCSEWYESYMRRFIRQLSLRNRKEIVESDILRVIEDSFQQLTFTSAREDLWDKVKQMGISSWLELEVKESQFITLMKAKRRFRVKKLSIIEVDGTSVNSYQELIDNLSRIEDCESLSLEFLADCKGSVIPYFPSVKYLSITSVTVIQQSLAEYVNTLHRLTLCDCSISDMSMLGSIPYLKLKDCPTIVDISSLNNNDHVVIEGCDGIQDYSQSFAFTRKIKIFLSDRAISYFDLNRWNNVQELHLSNWYGEVIFSQNCNQLPRTVKKCILGGDFISAIDFRVTSNHILNKLILSFNDTITCLEGYGLERLAIIECHSMISLQSLEGLGRGRNRKISIYICDQVSDFSPLNHVPIVDIKYCDGFAIPSQVRYVRDLRISSEREISFKSGSNDIYNPYENIHFLTLHGLRKRLNCEGLERIPHLTVDCDDYQLIRQYLTNGNQIQNQRIVLTVYLDFNVKDLLDLHNQYMKDHYDYYYNKLPSKWIWLRK